jgi:hypothetical protein
MNLRPVEPPQDSVISAREGVSNLLATEALGGGRLQILAVGPETTELELTAPHQVFVMDLDALLANRGLNSAHSVGWRYLVARGTQVVGAAETADRGESDSNRFSSLSRDPHVDRIAEAITSVESWSMGDDSEYELRLLRIPAAYSDNLWLHASNGDYLVPVAPAPPGLVPLEAYRPEQVLEILRQDVAEKTHDELSGG